MKKLMFIGIVLLGLTGCFGPYSITVSPEQPRVWHTTTYITPYTSNVYARPIRWHYPSRPHNHYHKHGNKTNVHYGHRKR